MGSLWISAGHFCVARRQNVHLKPEKDAADEVDFKGMEITQSWTGKGSLDMTDESQLNQVRVQLSTKNSSPASLDLWTMSLEHSTPKCCSFFVGNVWVSHEYCKTTLRDGSVPYQSYHLRHTSTIGTSRGLHSTVEPPHGLSWIDLPLAIPKAIPLNSQADFRTAGFRCSIFFWKAWLSPKICRDRKVASMDTSDTDDVYWRCTEKKVAGFSMEILPHVCPMCLWVEIEEVMAGWLVPWPAMCFTSTADNKIGRERLKCTWFSKVHSIQGHVYPFFPKETRRWCPDDVVVVWLRWPHRFGQIAASKVGERKRSRIAASKKTASDVLFQKLFRSSSPIFISCSSALGGNSHGFISIESDMTSTSYELICHVDFATLRAILFHQATFARGVREHVDRSACVIRGEPCCTESTLGVVLLWRTFGIFELNPVGFSTFL